MTYSLLILGGIKEVDETPQKKRDRGSKRKKNMQDQADSSHEDSAAYTIDGQVQGEVSRDGCTWHRLNEKVQDDVSRDGCTWHRNDEQAFVYKDKDATPSNDLETRMRNNVFKDRDPFPMFGSKTGMRNNVFEDRDPFPI